MKHLKIVCFLIFIFSTCSYAQGSNFNDFTKSKVYCTPPNYTGECIEFVNNKEFRYYSSDCTSSSFGSGLYNVEEELLTLNFIVQRPTIDPDGIRIERLDIVENQIEIDLKILDSKSKLPIIGSAVLLKDGVRQLRGKTTDFDGLVSFKFVTKIEKLELEIHYLNYKTVYLELNQGGKYSGEVLLEKSSDNIWPRNHKSEYKIHKFSKDSLLLSSIKEDSKVVSYYTRKRKN